MTNPLDSMQKNSYLPCAGKKYTVGVFPHDLRDFSKIISILEYIGIYFIHSIETALCQTED